MANKTKEMLELEAQVAKLMAENLALKASKVKAVTFKVSEKGGLSVYGLGRFPVTLYKQSWDRLLGEVENLKAALLDPKLSQDDKDPRFEKAREESKAAAKAAKDKAGESVKLPS